MMHVDWDRQRDDSRATDQIEVSRCRSSAKLIETVAHYDFFGTRERDADQSLRRRLLVSQDFTGRTKRFAGQANWHIEWYPCIEPRGAGCRLGGVAALAYVTYTLPRWADRRFANAPVGMRWDRYADSLLAHEKGHGIIAHQLAQMFEQELVGLFDMENCAEVTAEASRRVEKLIRRGEAMQNEYDRLTEHGNAQGVVFPF